MPSVAEHPILMLAFVALIAWVLGRFARPVRQSHPQGAPPEASFTGLDQARLADDIAGPMHRTLEQLRRELADIERRRVGADHELVQQVRGLERAASGLATALHSPKARGRWGELHLRRAVELAGMVSHCDFYEQARHTAPDDARVIQPDLIVRMAGGRCIAVDAKAPMDSWIAAVEATDASERLERESEHALRVRSHVRELAGRRYGTALAGGAALVVLYLPAEDLLRAALERDAALLEYAATQDIVLATPSSIIAILRGVAQGWREASFAENAARITRLGATMHDRIAIVNDHLAKLGRALDGSVRAYDETVGSLQARLLPVARELRELDVPHAREVEQAERVERVPRQIPSEV
ncbi:MAG: DNA recombination protein RmuC [Thermoleophilia bacterium]|nr:DNA recombination protein RmuC [Thermoleophilia bacterium]